MGADALASAGLQSGFVIAVVIAAVLLADRLGGGAALAQRVAQVGAWSGAGDACVQRDGGFQRGAGHSAVGV